MKKVLVVALSVLMLAALFIPALASDAPKFTTSVSAPKVLRGETVTVTVAVDKEVTGKLYALEYTSIAGAASQFEFVKAEYCAAINSGSMMTVPYKVSGVDGSVAGSNVAMAPITIGAGTMFTIELKAKADATFGTYPFEVKVLIDNVAQTTVGTTVEIYHECVPAAEYSKDDANHWKACTVAGCTVAPSKQGHSFDNACDTTCDICGHVRTVPHDFTKLNKDTNNHWMECSICGTKDETTVAAHTPKAEDVLVTPADCANAAVYKKVCSVCDTQIGATFSVGTPDASLHSGGTATCKDKPVCQHCSQSYGAVDPANHTGGTKIEVDGNEHYTKCLGCQAEIADTRAVHSGGTADCKNKAVCATCGQAYGELDPTTHIGGKADCKNKPVCDRCGESYGATNPDVHTGNVTVTPATPATCKNPGKTEEIACTDCGVVLTPSTPVEKEAHVITSWTVVSPATVDAEGEKKGECDACGDEFIVPIAKLTAALKEENVEAPAGTKIEAVGDTKLPEDTEAGVVVLTPEELEDYKNDEDVKAAIAENAEAANKDVLYVAVYGFTSTTIYVDPATGDVVLDEENPEKLPGEVKVTLPITADLSNYENLAVFAEDEDGDLVKIDATIADGKIEFVTDDTFNGVIIMGSAKQAPVNPNVPQNGDSSEVILFASMAIVSLLTLGAIFVSKKARACK